MTEFVTAMLMRKCYMVNLVCKKSDTNTKTNVHIFLPCLLVLFSRKVHRHTAQMFSGALPLSQVHPRAKLAALPRWIRVFLGREWCSAARLDKRQYRTHYIYYLQWMRTVKWCPGIFLMYFKPSRGFWHEGQMDFPIITRDVTHPV